MADLYALVYVSTATHLLGVGEIDRLLEAAQMRNSRAGLTGVLLYDAGSFMQYVEGPADAMASVYAKIKTSPLHGGIVELLREPIVRREFPLWSMAFRSVDAFGLSDPSHQADFLSQRAAAGEEPLSVARLLLSRFWQRGRHAHAF